MKKLTIISFVANTTFCALLYNVVDFPVALMLNVFFVVAALINFVDGVKRNE